MAFIAAFNKAPITRLKHTMKDLPHRSTKKLQDLERIMSAESSYKNYRAKIHTVNPPCIPYLGVYLLDLTYMEDGNPDTIGQLINFAKRRLVHTLIREVQQYQDLNFNFKPVEEIETLLKKVLFTSLAETAGKSMKEYEDWLFEVSLTREPRGVDRQAIL
jgi:hypothetical protein